MLLIKAQGLELEGVYVAVPQEAAFAVKNQNCVAPSCETWASIKIRLDYGYRIWAVFFINKVMQSEAPCQSLSR